ncbi:hypothetical protein [Pseudomonas aeruginosa]
MTDKKASPSGNELTPEGVRELESLRTKLGLPANATLQEVLAEVVRRLGDQEDIHKDE